MEYRIVVKGHIDMKWSEWFSGLSIYHDNDLTILKGLLLDQSAVYGVLLHLRDLNMTLLSIEKLS